MTNDRNRIYRVILYRTVGGLRKFQASEVGGIGSSRGHRAGARPRAELQRRRIIQTNYRRDKIELRVTWWRCCEQCVFDLAMALTLNRKLCSFRFVPFNSKHGHMRPAVSG